MLSGSTLVVDNTPWLRGYFSCEGFSFSNNYISIQDAVNNAESGDTIKICQGNYNEAVTIDAKDNLTITNGQDASSPADINWYNSGNTLTVKGNTEKLRVENLSIKSTAGNSNYKNIHIMSAKDKITFENLIVDTSNGASAIFFENNVDNDLEGYFKDLTITSKGQGIYINKGAQQEFDNLNITMTNSNPNYFGIYLGNNVQDKKHSFKNLTFSLKKDSAIRLTNGKDMNFENINITATDFTDNTEAISLQNNLSNSADLEFKDITVDLNAGVGINIKKAKDTKFENITIKGSSQWAIWLRDNVTGNPELKDITIEATKEGGIKIQKGKKVKIETATITGISGNGFAIWLTQNVTDDHNFKNINIITEAQAILVEKGDKVNFENITIKGNGNNANYYGIHTGQNVTGTIEVQNCNINVSGKALYIDKGKPKIQDSRFETRMEEKTLYFLQNVSKVELKNSCIYKDSSNGNAFGLYLYNNKNNNDIKDNCFYTSPLLENLAAANTQQNNVKKNYWDGLNASSYNYHNVTDNEPLSSCPNNCEGNIAPTPIINYHMDECSWDNDTNTYEIKNFGTLGNDYNATSFNNANTITDGKIYRAGDINSSTTQDKAILAKTDFSLPDTYTLTTWIKFPLNTDGHQRFRTGRGRNRTIVQYFNIADRVGSANDFIYFTKDIRRNSWSLSIKDDSDIDRIDFNPQNLSGWHMLTFVVTNNGTDFYLDKNKNYTFDTHPNTGELGLLYNSDYTNNNDNTPTAQSIGATVDEFQIFDQALDSAQIEDIYNYDGSDRPAPQCGGNPPPVERNYQFDARDIFRDQSDRNISTKIVEQTFQLTLMSLDENNSEQDFNGTVCSRVESTDGYFGDYNKTIWSDEKEKNASFTVSRAIGGNVNAVLYIKWYKNITDVACTENTENNETNSTDNFAVRPEKFNIINISSPIYAGEDFNITFQALKAGGGNASDYNETTTDSSFIIESNSTKAGCITGTLHVDDVNFSDGNASDINATYTNLGDVNITIKDSNDSNSFAYVDYDDTNDTQRLISPATVSIYVKPYDINVTDITFTVSTQDNWLYMADNINDMNITLNTTVKAFNKQGNILQDFNSTCYGQDLNVSFYYDVNNSNADVNLTLDGNLTSNDVNISDVNKTLQIPKELFISGEANSSYAFGINRKYNEYKNPKKVTLNDVNITTNIAKYQNGKTLDSNNSATFYYGRTYTQDLATSKSPDTAKVEILVYDDNTSNGFVSGLKEELLDWYLNSKHNDKKFGDINESVPSKSTVKSSTTDISTTVNFNTNGTFDVNITNSEDKTGTYYIHLGEDKWLWYVPKNFGGDYNYSNDDSNCTTHPCIKYNYEQDDNQSGVKSGSTTGVQFDVNVSKNNRGVRLLR